MTVKNILVAYSGWDSSQCPLKHALKIANEHDAWVTGIVGHGRSHVLSLLGGQAPRELVETIQQSEAHEIARVKDVFTDLVQQQGRADASEFFDVVDQDGATVASIARTFDLVVTARQTQDPVQRHMSASPDMIALQSGRPVLIVPKDYDAPGLSTHVVVAWDGKRAAARAIGDAMEMLEEKGKVTVLTIGKTAPEGTERLIANLKRHGINAEHAQHARSGSVGSTILSVTETIRADLIVMGAYEHSKFSHDVFGGVTTDVIRDATVPVLMSH
ncbi:universal stress protein [Gymnodinialimonas sp.]